VKVKGRTRNGSSGIPGNAQAQSGNGAAAMKSRALASAASVIAGA
jgi:hypothetical protein